MGSRSKYSYPKQKRNKRPPKYKHIIDLEAGVHSVGDTSLESSAAAPENGLVKPSNGFTGPSSSAEMNFSHNTTTQEPFGALHGACKSGKFEGQLASDTVTSTTITELEPALTGDRVKLFMAALTRLPRVTIRGETELFIQQLDSVTQKFTDFRWLFQTSDTELSWDQRALSLEVASVICEKVTAFRIPSYVKDFADRVYQFIQARIFLPRDPQPYSGVQVVPPLRQDFEDMSIYLSRVERWLTRNTPTAPEEYLELGSAKHVYLIVLANFMWCSHEVLYAEQMQNLKADWFQLSPYFRSAGDVIRWFRNQECLHAAKTGQTKMNVRLSREAGHFESASTPSCIESPHEILAIEWRCDAAQPELPELHIGNTLKGRTLLEGGSILKEDNKPEEGKAARGELALESIGRVEQPQAPNAFALEEPGSTHKVLSGDKPPYAEVVMQKEHATASIRDPKQKITSKAKKPESANTAQFPRENHSPREHGSTWGTVAVLCAFSAAFLIYCSKK